MVENGSHVECTGKEWRREISLSVTAQGTEDDRTGYTQPAAARMCNHPCVCVCVCTMAVSMSVSVCTCTVASA